MVRLHSFSLAASFRRDPPLFVDFQVSIFCFIFQREREREKQTEEEEERKNGIHETVCNDTKTTTEEKNKKIVEIVVKIIVCFFFLEKKRGGGIAAVPFFQFLFSHSSPLFKKKRYLFLFVLFNLPFNFPAGVFFFSLTFTIIHR